MNKFLSRLTCFILTLCALPGGILKNSPKSSSMVTIASSVQRVQLKDFSWYEIPTHSGSSSHNFWHLNCVCFPMCLFFSHIHSSIHNSNKIYKGWLFFVIDRHGLIIPMECNRSFKYWIHLSHLVRMLPTRSLRGTGNTGEAQDRDSYYDLARHNK